MLRCCSRRRFMVMVRVSYNALTKYMMMGWSRRPLHNQSALSKHNVARATSASCKISMLQRNLPADLRCGAGNESSIDLLQPLNVPLLALY
jgi:hypothetical protein